MKRLDRRFSDQLASLAGRVTGGRERVLAVGAMVGAARRGLTVAAARGCQWFSAALACPAASVANSGTSNAREKTTAKRRLRPVRRPQR